MILGIISAAIPLFIISIGALISEYSGRPALFLDSVINLSAFLCFTQSYLLKSIPAGILCTLLFSPVLIMIFSFLVEYFKANPFLAALAAAAIIEGLITAFSVKIFGTRGVLTFQTFAFNREEAKTLISIILFFISFFITAFLELSRKGLYYKICGKNAAVLEDKGINVFFYKTKAWMLSAFCASLAGCAYSIYISAYTPNISGGKGWIALVIIFLGKKNIYLTALAAFIFSAAEYAASYFQNIFPNIPSAFLIAMPYIAAITLIALQPVKK